MNNCKKLFKIFSLIIISAMLCGCPPLRYNIFVRNTTLDNVQLFLTYEIPDTAELDKRIDSFYFKEKIRVHAANKLIPVKKGAILKLTDSLFASNDRGQILLEIPPTTTVSLMNIADAFYEKMLIIRQPGKSDTVDATYPYRALKKMKNVKRRVDGLRFYRTSIWYDIK